MQYVNRANLPPDVFAAVMRGLPLHHTLLAVTEWGLAQQSVLRVSEVVTQDEFTHDLVLPWRDGLVLVYGAT